MDKETAERLTVLEMQQKEILKDLAASEAKVKDLEKRLGYYDKLALKYGSACLGALALGALLGGGLDKIKDKIWSWFL